MTSGAEASPTEGVTLPLDLARLRGEALRREPFTHLLLPGFLTPAALAAVNGDFPPIADGGTHAPWLVRAGTGFRALVRAVSSPAFAEALGAKLGLALAGRPVVVSVRGYSRAKDGRVHRDSRRKLASALLYLNESWEGSAGRLRLLRQPHDLEDYAVEVPPDGGTLLAFVCSPDAWHGHLPFVGQRRVLQVNWMTSRGAGLYEESRFAFSYLCRRFGIGRGLGA